MVQIDSMIQKRSGILQPVQTSRQIIFDIETSGLEAFEHRILCITIMDVKTLEIKSFCQENEEQLLKDFFEEVKHVNRFIGYNSQPFDVPFIIQRCLFYGVRLTDNFMDIKCQLDLRKHALGFFISFNKFQKGKLGQWAEKFGTPMETHAGSFMPKLFLAKDWKGIQKHCEEDVVVTKKLYDRCKICNVIF